MTLKMKRSLWIVPALAMSLFLFSGRAHADSFVTAVTNNASFGNGPIQTWSLDLTTGTATAVGSFIPDGAAGSNNGRGVAVTNTQIYYTELTGGFGPTTNIETAPFNGGAGGADNGAIPNPIPGTGIADIHFGSSSSGDLFALSGYPSQPGGPTVYAFNATTGLIDGSVPLVQLKTDPGADGFTILPNGNYLVNQGDAVNAYDQYDPLTGLRIAGTTISAGPNCGSSTGVDTDGTHLFFNCNLSSISETDLNGNFIQNFTLPGTFGVSEGLSLVENFNPPPPGQTVPEPSSLLLLGAGLAVLLFGHMRKLRPPMEA